MCGCWLEDGLRWLCICCFADSRGRCSLLLLLSLLNLRVDGSSEVCGGLGVGERCGATSTEREVHVLNLRCRLVSGGLGLGFGCLSCSLSRPVADASLISLVIRIVGLEYLQEAFFVQFCLRDASWRSQWILRGTS